MEATFDRLDTYDVGVAFLEASERLLNGRIRHQNRSYLSSRHAIGSLVIPAGAKESLEPQLRDLVVPTGVCAFKPRVRVGGA